jgi:hypothetical protein
MGATGLLHREVLTARIYRVNRRTTFGHFGLPNGRGVHRPVGGHALSDRHARIEIRAILVSDSLRSSSMVVAFLPDC